MGGEIVFDEMMGLQIDFVVGLWVEEMYVLGFVCVEGMYEFWICLGGGNVCYVWVGMYVLSLGGGNVSYGFWVGLRVGFWMG